MTIKNLNWFRCQFWISKSLAICIDSVKKNWIEKSQFGTKTQIPKHGKTDWRGRISTVDIVLLTSLDELLFYLFLTIQVISIWGSTVLSLPVSKGSMLTHSPKHSPCISCLLDNCHSAKCHGIRSQLQFEGNCWTWANSKFLPHSDSLPPTSMFTLENVPAYQTHFDEYHSNPYLMNSNGDLNINLVRQERARWGGTIKVKLV